MQSINTICELETHIPSTWKSVPILWGIYVLYVFWKLVLLMNCVWSFLIILLSKTKVHVPPVTTPYLSLPNKLFLSIYISIYLFNWYKFSFKGMFRIEQFMYDFFWNIWTDLYTDGITWTINFFLSHLQSIMLVA